MTEVNPDVLVMRTVPLLMLRPSVKVLLAARTTVSALLPSLPVTVNARPLTAPLSVSAAPPVTSIVAFPDDAIVCVVLATRTPGVLTQRAAARC